MAEVNPNLTFLLDELPNIRIAALQGSTRCFTGNTLVRTNSGLKQIKDIEVGDLVLSVNLETNISEYQKVNEKYYYKATQIKQELIIFTLYNQEVITCTEHHEIYFEGRWVEARELAKRKMENGSGVERLIHGKHRGATNDTILQKDWTVKNNETSKRRRWLLTDNDLDEREGLHYKNAPHSCDDVFGEYQQPSRSESYQSRPCGQSGRKLGVGVSPAEYKTHGGCREGNGKQWNKKWHVEIDRESSSGDKTEVHALCLHGETFGSRVRVKQDDSKKYYSQKDLGACEITLNDIKSVSTTCNQDVYDLCVNGNHNYTVTSQNYLVHNSGKTYSTLQYLIRLGVKYKGIKISICRSTLPALKATVLTDFIEILESVGLYDEKNHNKTDHVYYLNGNSYDFFSLDDHRKVMGRKRDILYINEALECDYNSFRQLALRTRGKIILDFNPFEAEHWVYDQVQTRSDCKTLITTYKDNPHISDSQREEIELLKDSDPDYWKVFGEGIRATGGSNIIYHNWKVVKECPFKTDKVYYGLDFGYAISKTAMVEGHFNGNEVYITEKLYRNNYTTGDLIVYLPEIVQDYRHIEADSARPESIEEINRAGYNIHPTQKFAGSVKAGIDMVKRYTLLIDENSINLQKELRYYKWQSDKNGKATEEPLKVMDDFMDALRYMIEGYHRINVIAPIKTKAKMANRKPVFKDFR